MPNSKKLPEGYEKCTRRIYFDAYRPSGKWYSSGYAYIEPGNFYFDSRELLRTIDVTNDQLVKGALADGAYTVAIREPSLDPDVFVSRLILATGEPRDLHLESLAEATGKPYEELRARFEAGDTSVVDGRNAMKIWNFARSLLGAS